MPTQSDQEIAMKLNQLGSLMPEPTQESFPFEAKPASEKVAIKGLSQLQDLFPEMPDPTPENLPQILPVVCQSINDAVDDGALSEDFLCTPPQTDLDLRTLGAIFKQVGTGKNKKDFQKFLAQPRTKPAPQPTETEPQQESAMETLTKAMGSKGY